MQTQVLHEVSDNASPDAQEEKFARAKDLLEEYHKGNIQLSELADVFSDLNYLHGKRDLPDNYLSKADQTELRFQLVERHTGVRPDAQKKVQQKQQGILGRLWKTIRGN